MTRKYYKNEIVDTIMQFSIFFNLYRNTLVETLSSDTSFKPLQSCYVY